VLDEDCSFGGKAGMTTMPASEDPGLIVLRVLGKGVDASIYVALFRRYDLMTRELRYILQRNDARMSVAAALTDWPTERLHVACAFNCFYQLVLGPLEAASRKWKSKPFRALTIAHGSLHLDPDRAMSLRVMINQFDIMMNRLAIPAELLSAATTGEIIFRIERRWRERNEDE
jgi:hypothetical protein